MFVYSCHSYPTFRAHLFWVVLNCHLCPVWLYHMFSHCLIHDTIFVIYIYIYIYIYIRVCIYMYIYIYCTLNTSFDFFLQLLPEIIFILRRIQQDININVHRSSREVPNSWQILVRLKFSGYIFEKSSNFKFHQNPSSGGRVFPFGRTEDRQKWRG